MTDTSTLPLNWLVVTVSDVSAYIRGVSYDKSQAHMVPGDGRIALLRANNFSDNGFDLSDIIFVDTLAISPEQHITTGDIIFAMSSGSKRHVGKSVLARRDMNAAFGAFCGLLRPIQGVIPAFLAWQFYGQEFRRRVESVAMGTNINNLKSSELLRFPIVLAPLAEQQRIVSKIEELFSELDAGTESLMRARAQLKTYRQALLKAAFEGKFTAEWRATNPDKLESPEIILSRISSEREVRYARSVKDWHDALVKWRADGEVGRKPTKPIRLSEPPVTKQIHEGVHLPLGWAHIRVDSLCEVVRGGSPRPAGDPQYYGGPIPFLKVADLTRTPCMYVSSNTYTITEAGLAKTRLTPKGTLMISNSGATLGIPKICTIDATFNDGIAAFLGLHSDDLEFHYYFWVSKTAELRGLDQGAAQPNLNTSILGETLIPICSREEMMEVVSYLSSRLSQVDATETEIDVTLSKINVLRQSILNKAFSGQLVQQAPDDEPAATVLARLHSQASSKAPRRGKKIKSVQ